MKFIQQSNGAIFLWIEDKMILENIHGGWSKIDENDPYWMEAKIIEANSWHDLYLKTGYVGGLLGDIWDNNLWVSPEGRYFKAEAHLCAAEDICEYLYGLDYDALLSMGLSADDYLISEGWAKVCTGGMWPYYAFECLEMWRECTNECFSAVIKYCDQNKIPHPKF